MIDRFKGIKELRITAHESSKIIGDYTKFNSLKFDASKLAELREKYDLESVTCHGSNDWEIVLLLREWITRQWKYGFSNKPEPKSNNAVDILEAAGNGATFACGTYASVMEQCCYALGIPARMVSILREGSDVPIPEYAMFVGHCVTEVWSDHFRKWIVHDPTTNWHYEKKGIPLNSYEVSRAWTMGEEGSVEQVPFVAELSVDDEDLVIQLKGFYDASEKFYGKAYADAYISDKNQLIWLWKQFTMNKSMHFYSSVIIPAGDAYYAFMYGYSIPDLLVNEYPIQRAWPELKWTSDPDDVYFSLDQTMIRLRVQDETDDPVIKIEVKLNNTDPFFDHYIVDLNGMGWERKNERFIWKPNEGDNTISACTVNKYGRKGIESSISVAYSKK